jgi:excisionase family DNA binding protein
MTASLPPDSDQPLRIKAVAQWLGISDKTVRRRIDSGAMRSVKMGGLRVVLPSDFRAYWDSVKQAGGQHV